MTRTQRRWGRRVRKQARKEVLRLAETKRFWIWNEAWNYQGILPYLPGTAVGETMIANAFSPPALGVGDQQFIGNQVINPLVVLSCTVHLNWERIQTYWAPRIPTIIVEAYLIAVNDQLTNVPPVAADATGRNFLFLRHPDTNQRWMLNKQNLMVIKRKRIKFSSRNLSIGGVAVSHESRTFKLKKWFKGTKTYEQSVGADGTLTPSVYLKGWNFYWMVINQWSVPNTVQIPGSSNPIQISADRLMYFKDF